MEWLLIGSPNVMALLKCPECGNSISGYARTCPSCGTGFKSKEMTEHQSGCFFYLFCFGGAILLMTLFIDDFPFRVSLFLGLPVLVLALLIWISRGS